MPELIEAGVRLLAGRIHRRVAARHDRRRRCAPHWHGVRVVPRGASLAGRGADEASCINLAADRAPGRPKPARDPRQRLFGWAAELRVHGVAGRAGACPGRQGLAIRGRADGLLRARQATQPELQRRPTRHTEIPQDTRARRRQQRAESFTRKAER